MSTHHQEELPGAISVSSINSSNSSRGRTLDAKYSPRTTCSNTLSATKLVTVRPQIWSHSITCCNRATFEFYKLEVMPIFHRLGAKQKQLGKTYLHKYLWWNWWHCQVSCRLGDCFEMFWGSLGLTTWSNHQQSVNAEVALFKGLPSIE